MTRQQIHTANAQTKACKRVCLPQRTPDRYTDEKEHRSDNIHPSRRSAP
jgi:hypothetical protein